MNKIVIAILATMFVTSCGTTVTGEKTFLDRTASQWGDIGLATGKRAAPILKEEYDNTASK